MTAKIHRPIHLAAGNGHVEVCELIIGQFVEKIPIHINPSNLYRNKINTSDHINPQKTI